MFFSWLDEGYGFAEDPGGKVPVPFHRIKHPNDPCHLLVLELTLITL